MRFLKKEKLKTKPTLIVVFAMAAAVVSVGYIMTLAVLSPEQLAEATILATDLICNGCVETSDIANNVVTSAKIGSGQVGASDIASSAVTSSKISDTNGVSSVDIVNGEVTSADIRDGTITSTDIVPGTIPPGGGVPADNSVTSEKIVDDEVQPVDIANATITAQDIAEGTIRGGNIKDDTIQDADIGPGAIPTTVIKKTETVYIDPYRNWTVIAECPDGYFATGGGYRINFGRADILGNQPKDTHDAWEVTFRSLSGALSPLTIRVSAVCIE